MVNKNADYVDYKYEGNQGRAFSIPKKERSKLPDDIAAFIYRSCQGCALKTKKIDILGGHCSFDGTLKLHDKKCIMKK